MIQTVSQWARPAIDSFLKDQTLPGKTTRQDLPGTQATEWFETSADQFDQLRSSDNGPQDMDPTPNSVRVHLEGTNADSVVRFEGDSEHGMMVAGLCVQGSDDSDTVIVQRFEPGAQDTVGINRDGKAFGVHVEPGFGFLLTGV